MALRSFIKLLKQKNNEMFGIVEVEKQDVGHNPAVEAVLNIYGDENI